MLHAITDALVAFGPLGVLVLAVLDSAGIPLPAAMDALLILVAVKSPERGWISACCATVGSLGGNLALFYAARKGGRRWVKVPEPGEPQKFRSWFRRYGLFSVFVPAILPIPLPLKVFVVSAGVLHTSFAQFVTVILVARVIRYFGEAYLGMKLGEQGAMAFLKGNAWTMTLVVLAFGLALYLAARYFERRRQAV